MLLATCYLAMKIFAELYRTLDTTSRPREKIRALVWYLRNTPPEDAIWAIYLLLGKMPSRVVKPQHLREWALEMAALPAWLYEENLNTVKDDIETATLLLPDIGHEEPLPLHILMEQTYLPLQTDKASHSKEIVTAAWMKMDASQRLVWNKLLTGGFRPGMSEKLIVTALALYSGLAETILAYRLRPEWEPTPEAYQALLSPDVRDAAICAPYLFAVAQRLEAEPEDLGRIQDWQVEWLWDGLRAQIIKRKGQIFIWSKEAELFTEKFPEFAELGEALPDGTALDGIIMTYSGEHPLNSSQLPKRLQRKRLAKAVLPDIPVRFMAVDLLEFAGQDIRNRSFSQRHAQLTALIADIANPRLHCSSALRVSNWAEVAAFREQARERGVAGVIIKRRGSAYHAGETQGDWQAWRRPSLHVKAVLIYAQRGEGTRAHLYADYTFAVWDGARLVPFAKTGSGLTEAEIQEVDRFVRQNTVERFGPVRSVTPALVFEIRFDHICASSRHKSGMVVSAPQIARWRREMLPEEADTLHKIRTFIRKS